MMKIAAIIPSRYYSSRFQGKPLVKINDIPMIERVYRQVEKSGKFSHTDIIVATDDQRIAGVVRGFGGTAALTSPDHQSGSERLWEILETHGFRDYEAAINIQGDEPIISPELIDSLYEQLETGKYDVVTPAYYSTSYEDYLSANVVKVVVDTDFHALYFSRSPIPFFKKQDFTGFYQHMGMYGYLRDALKRFIILPKSKLEIMEKLEQLRFLENNMKIKVIISKHKSIGVDVPEDVTKVEKILNEKL